MFRLANIFSHANELIANFLKKEATLECVFDRCTVVKVE